MSVTEFEAVYRVHDAGLRRRLRGRFASAPADLLDDALANAWVIGWRRRHRLDAATMHRWLWVVARNEAIRLLVLERRAVPVADVVTAPYREGYHELQDALEALATCRPDQIRALYGQALGLTYHDLEAALGWTYTKVNRSITEGRAAARAAWAANAEAAAA